MKHIVFTRYNEAADRILNVYDNLTSGWQLFVYDRGVDKLTLPNSERLIHVHDENNGREDGGYLRHIIENYDSLEDTVIFTQGLYDDSEYQTRGNFNQWMDNIQNKNYESYITSQVMCSLDGRPNHPNLPIEKVWYLIFGDTKSLPSIIYFHPCAIFATCGTAIRTHSVDFYKNIYTLTSNPQNNKKHDPTSLEIPWCLERFWQFMFEQKKPIETLNLNHWANRGVAG